MTETALEVGLRMSGFAASIVTSAVISLAFLSDIHRGHSYVVLFCLRQDFTVYPSLVS